MTDQLHVDAVEGGVRFAIRVAPRASHDAIGGVHDGALRVRVTAPPVDGAANAAILKLLARALRVAKRDVEIVSGQSARTKTVVVRGASIDDVRALA